MNLRSQRSRQVVVIGGAAVLSVGILGAVVPYVGSTSDPTPSDVAGIETTVQSMGVPAEAVSCFASAITDAVDKGTLSSSEATRFATGERIQPVLDVLLATEANGVCK